MLKLIRRIAADDVAIKLLFDHVRNIGIFSVIFGAAFWEFNHPGTFPYLNWVIIALLVFIGIFLFLVNTVHGFQKLREAQIPEWVLRLAMYAYLILAVTIAFSVIQP